MSVIIVSEDVYINAKRINHISIYEQNNGPNITNVDEDPFHFLNNRRAPARKKPRLKRKKKDTAPPPPEYVVQVSYTSEDDSIQELHIRKSQRAAAKKIYKDIVNQIREQCPDKAMMDRLISTHLFGEEQPK